MGKTNQDNGVLMQNGKPPVTVLGLGLMGVALARAFVKAGHQTTVWNRTPGKAEDLAEAKTAAEAAAASDLVIVCVLDYAAAEEVLNSGNIAGRTVVNLTNGTPRQARELAAWADGQHARYVDGGIMAVPPMIGRPGSTLVYSGSRYAYDTYESVLGVLGAGTFVGEDSGLAALYDLSLLSAMYGLHGGALNAFALAGSEKVAAKDLLKLLQPWLQAMLGILPRFAEQIDSGDFRTGVASKLEMQLAAFPNFLDASKDQGVRPDFLLPMFELMKERVAAGHGDEDGAGIVEILKESAR
jgi:3-hydroxyisobutyrate dehydrogenase-like beta-hydroxyacid dehydrogenase